MIFFDVEPSCAYEQMDEGLRTLGQASHTEGLEEGLIALSCLRTIELDA